jgi:hypothetical protein
MRGQCRDNAKDTVIHGHNKITNASERGRQGQCEKYAKITRRQDSCTEMKIASEAERRKSKGGKDQEHRVYN